MLVRVAQLTYLMLPAYAANMAPPFLRFWHGWNPPISTRWLGGHKTVLGVLAGVAAAVTTAALQASAAWEDAIVTTASWPSLGVRLGVGAMAGDAVKSFFKRQVGIAPGRPWIPFDQLDFAIGALVLVAPVAGLGILDVVVILVVTIAGHITVNHIGYAVGVRETPW